MTKNRKHHEPALLLLAVSILATILFPTALASEDDPEDTTLVVYSRFGEDEDFKTTLFPGQRLTFYAAGSVDGDGTHNWSSQGRDLFNNRDVETTLLTADSIDLENPMYRIITDVSTSATPAISGDTIIYPSWDGSIRANNIYTGENYWIVDIGMAYYGLDSPGEKVSTSTPVFSGRDTFLLGMGVPADVLMIRVKDGNLIWLTTVDFHPFSVVTASGAIWNNIYYVGVSSIESIIAEDDSEYPCCTFVGSVVALRLRDGTILWQTYTISLDVVGLGGFSGAAVWGSSPSIWSEMNLVFVATGNNYASPDDYELCILEETAAFCNSLVEFLPPGDYNLVDGVLALDIRDGTIVWFYSAAPYDAWIAYCPDTEATNCASFPVTYAGFGMAPVLDFWCTSSSDDYINLLNANELSEDDVALQTVNGVPLPVTDDLPYCVPALYIGQMTGALYSLVAQTGGLIWANKTSPAGSIGGLSWGIAVDGLYIYISVANTFRCDWTLTNGTVAQCGGWGSFYKVNGNARWTITDPACWDPSGGPGNFSSNGRSTSAAGIGPPVSLGEDLVLVGSADTWWFPDLGSGEPTYGHGGWAYALSKTDGTILDSFETGATIYGGFSASGECAYLGSGYLPFFGFSEGNSVYGWCPDPFIVPV